MDLARKIVDDILCNNFSLFNQPHTDELTNQVRNLLDNLNLEDYKLAKNNMEIKLINIDEDYGDNFLLKENLVYYLGRGMDINYILLKDIYFKEKNLHLKLNLFFSLLSSFDEEIEFDFIDKISPGNELDIIIRSWTMAFFANSETPYDYIDTCIDDPSKAIKARLDRFTILLDSNNKKYKKALSYLYIDLTVIWLFINSRDSDVLFEEDYKIINNIPDNHEEFSIEKNERIRKVKGLILNKKER